ncbi:hypothetical protein TNIN_304761 [Trichonephila inaurata madagascariensis]|uniref:Uncharacterized protein n=1 Tax=Trichonephila inaurata madagascariensis TaxID=2747483 RepID=A0A8X6WTT1_9ARAC|nr:hypothetical protein TNIN_304761 [Trichonephila inaurata madagascariensis]
MIGTSVSRQNRVPVTMETRVVPAVSWFLSANFFVAVEFGTLPDERTTVNGDLELMMSCKRGCSQKKDPGSSCQDRQQWN